MGTQPTELLEAALGPNHAWHMARGLCEDYRSEADYACFEEGRLEFVAGLPHHADRVSRNQTRYRHNILQPIL